MKISNTLADKKVQSPVRAEPIPKTTTKSQSKAGRKGAHPVAVKSSRAKLPEENGSLMDSSGCNVLPLNIIKKSKNKKTSGNTTTVDGPKNPYIVAVASIHDIPVIPNLAPDTPSVVPGHVKTKNLKMTLPASTANTRNQPPLTGYAHAASKPRVANFTGSASVTGSSTSSGVLSASSARGSRKSSSASSISVVVKVPKMDDLDTFPKLGSTRLKAFSITVPGAYGVCYSVHADILHVLLI